MYRCEVCSAVSEAGQQKLTVAIKRPNGTTEREVALCGDCHATVVNPKRLDYAIRELSHASA